MNKFCLLFLHLAASYVTWGWRKGWYWKIHIDIQFTLNYVLPGTCTQKTVQIDGNKEVAEFAVISYFVFKVHFKKGDIDVWVQATELENSQNLFKIDWIQVKHNDVEIGRITGPKYIEGGFHKVGYNKNIIYIQNHLSFIDNNIHICVESFCVNTAFNYDAFFNDIQSDHVCASKTTSGYTERIKLPYLYECEKDRSKEFHITVGKNGVNPSLNNKKQNEKPSLAHAFFTYDYKAFEKSVTTLNRTQYQVARHGKNVAAIIGVIILIVVISMIGYVVYRKKYVTTPAKTA